MKHLAFFFAVFLASQSSHSSDDQIKWTFPNLEIGDCRSYLSEQGLPIPISPSSWKRTEISLPYYFTKKIVLDLFQFPPGSLRIPPSPDPQPEFTLFLANANSLTQVIKTRGFTESTHNLTVSFKGYFFIFAFESEADRGEFINQDTDFFLTEGTFVANGKTHYLVGISVDHFDKYLDTRSRPKQTCSVQELESEATHQSNTIRGTTYYFRDDRVIGYAKEGFGYRISLREKKPLLLPSHLEILKRQIGPDWSPPAGMEENPVAQLVQLRKNLDSLPPSEKMETRIHPFASPNTKLFVRFVWIQDQNLIAFTSGNLNHDQLLQLLIRDRKPELNRPYEEDLNHVQGGLLRIDFNDQSKLAHFQVVDPKGNFLNATQTEIVQTSLDRFNTSKLATELYYLSP